MKNNKSKTIWHVGAWNRNYGDQVLQASIRENLQGVSEIPLNFVPVDCQNTHFFDELIERLNNEADMLLIGGGGLIFNRQEDNSLSGWQFSITKENLSKIKVPIVIYGIGYNQFNYDTRGFKEGLNEHLIETQKIAALFSVRNHGTKRELISRGLDEHKIEVIPDAGSFLTPSRITIPGLDQARLKIGVNWVSDRPFYTFPEPHEKSRKEVIENITAAFKHFANEHDAQIVCIEHIAQMDKEIVEYMRSQLGANLISVENDMPHIFPPSLVYAPFLIDIYRQLDVVIGMRGHANIIPFGTGTPFIGLSSHNKNRFFMEEIGEKEYMLDIREYESSCSKENIIAKVESLLSDKVDYSKRTGQRFHELKNLFDAFNKKVIDLLIG